jgi:hypothetical protein
VRYLTFYRHPSFFYSFSYLLHRKLFSVHVFIAKLIKNSITSKEREQWNTKRTEFEEKVRGANHEQELYKDSLEALKVALKIATENKRKFIELSNETITFEKEFCDLEIRIHKTQE